MNRREAQVPSRVRNPGRPLPPTGFGQQAKAALQAVALATVYAFVAWGSLFLFAQINAQASPVWPPTGIAIAALLLWGIRLWPGVFLGAFVANLLASGQTVPSLGIALGNTMEAMLAALLMQRYANGSRPFERVADTFRFLLASLAAPVLGASVGVATLAGAGSLDPDLAPAVWFTWWLGDATGALVFAPLLLLWLQPAGEPIASGRRLELVAAGLTGVVLPVLVFLDLLLQIDHAPLSFILVLLVAWTALRFRNRETAAMTGLLAFTATWGTLSGHGPFAVLSANLSLLVLQTFLGVLSATGLLLAASAREARVTHLQLEAEHAVLERRVLERTLDLAARKGEAEAATASLEAAQAIAHLGSWFWDLTSNAVGGSAEMRRIHGVAPGVTLDFERAFQLVHPEDRPGLHAALQETMRTGRPLEFRYRVVREDGSIRWVLLHAHLERDPGGRPARMTGTALDFTEQRATEEKFRTLLEVAPDAYLMVDREGRIVLVNQQAERLFGYTRAELLELGVEDLVPDALRARHSAHREGYMRDPHTRPMGQGLDLQARRKDGSTVAVEISLSPLQTTEGLRVVAAVRDVSLRKQIEAEVAEARRKTAATEKLAALGTLVAGVGHEVRTPLTYIATNAALIRLRLQKAAEAGIPVADVQATLEKPLASIHEGVQRIDRIVRQMRQFAKAELKVEEAFLHEVLAGAIDLWKATHRGDVEVRVDLQPVPAFAMDKGQVQQIAINLLNNGAEAMGGTGKLDIRLRHEGRLAVVEVEDHGPGIADAIQRRIWDPFFTTKPEGTGLGLSVSRRIVEAHGGLITYETRPTGTTFRIELPLEVKR